MRTHRRLNTIVLALAFLLLSTFSLFAGTGSTWSLSIEGDDFVITRGGNTSCKETVLYRTVSLSAIAGQHFTDTSGSVTFGPGDKTKRISVALLTPSSDSYKYQVGSERSFRFEITEPGGNILTSIDRTITTGTNVSANAFGILDITVNSGTITVKDENYVQAYHAVPVSNYFSQAPKSYLSLVDASSLRMTLSFQAAEYNDGYQHVQILVNQTSNHDEGAGDNNPGTINYSSYMACFVHEGGTANSTFANYSFPVTSQGDLCGKVGKVWSGNSVGELRQQKFNTNTRATDGRLIIPADLTTLGIRFDASGDNEDTWYAKNTVAHIQAIDTTIPTILANSEPVVSSGYHAKGNTFYVSIPFSEIVKVTGTPSLSTTWGTLDYCYGSNTNVLTFRGKITANPGTQLKVNSISGTIKDLAGNELEVSEKTINKTFSSMTVDAAVTYTITFDTAGGSAISSQTYTYESEDITLPTPTRTGYRFDGWTGNNGTEAQTTVTVPQHSFGNLTYTAHWTDVWGMNTNPNGGPLYPYLITSTDGLVLLAECIARDGSYANKTFVLEADIDMSGISDFGIGTESYPFRGKIDGKNHVIRNLVLGSSSQSTVGLIRYFRASLQNLIIDGATVEGADNTGIAVGAFVVENGISGRVNDCYVFNSSITCANSYGIFSADNSGTLSNSHYRNVTINGADPVSDIFTITKDSRLSISTAPAITYQQIAYYPQGSTVTVTSADPDRYALSSVTVTYGENTIEATKVDDYSFSFTMPSADIDNITAVYTPVDYTITYDLGGGTAADNTEYSYNCETSTFTLKKPTRTGYRFDGWTGSNGDTPETTVTIAQGGYGNLTYTAHWTDVWGMDTNPNGGPLYPYRISTPDGLELLAECIARDGSFANKCFVLESDIDMSGISDFGIGTESYPFSGIFNANNHVIRNLKLGSSNQSPVGLFPYYDGYTINNLIIDGATIEGEDRTGVIFGESDKSVKDCFVFNSSITCANTYGIFTAGTGSVTNSHYRDVTINGADPVSDIFTVTADPALFRVSGTPAVTYKGVDYYTEGSEVTIEYIGYGNDDHLGYYPTFSASAGTVSGNKLTMPAGDVTITPVYTDVWGITEGATGRSSKPYTIKTPEGLVLLAQTVNSGNSLEQTHFSLGNDLNMSGISFPGIGNRDIPFKGFFHGNYKIIRNLTAGTYGETEYIGLFGNTYTAQIENVIIENAVISGKSYVGGIVGNLYGGKITGCLVVNSNFSGERYTAPLSGCKTGYNISLENSYAIDNNIGNNAFTITAGEGVTVNTEPTFSYGGTDYYADNTSISITVTPKEGYTLEGLSIIPSNSYYSLNNDSFNYSFTINANCELLAVWTLNEYSIDYNLGGGTATNPASYTYEDADFTLTIPTRTGYRFLGWTGSNGDTPQKDITITNGSTGNRSYTANWSDDLWGLEAGADGTKEYPYVITEREGLVYLAETVNSGNSCSGVHFVLGYDIDMDGIQFAGIGNQDNPFSGNFDGKRKEISYLRAGTYKETDYIGLFGHTENANVENVIVRDAYVRGNKYVGCLIGYMDGGSATNCLVVESRAFGWDDEETSPRIGHCSGTCSTEGTHSIMSRNETDDAFAINYPSSVSFINKPDAEYEDVVYFCSGTEISFTIIEQEGFTFDEVWYYIGNTSFNIPKNDDGTFSFIMPNTSAKIYIDWETIQYTIEYNLNGGTATNKDSYNVYTADFSLNKPTRMGYTFIGWTGSNGNTPQLDVTIPWRSTGNRTYTANWAGLWGQDNGAEGSEEQPYVITTPEGLIHLSDAVNSEATYNDYCDKHYLLGNDIDLTGSKNSICIGKNDGCYFKGVFDGNGHVIRAFGLYASQDGYPNGAGLFCQIKGGTVRNLIIDTAEIVSEASPVGIIAGSLVSREGAISRIENCYIFDSYTMDSNGAIRFSICGSSDNDSVIVNNYKNVSSDSESNIFSIKADPDVFRITNKPVVKYLGLNYYTSSEITIEVITSDPINKVVLDDEFSVCDATKVDENTYSFYLDSDIELHPVFDAEATFALQNLALGDQIGLRFWMDLSALTDEQKASGVMTFNVKGSPEQTVTYAEAETDTYNGVTYPVFRCRLNAVQMADTVTAVFTYQKDGKPVSISKTYSVEEYITAFDTANATTPFEDKYVDIVQALADYGYYSQQFLSRTRGWTIGEDHAKMNTYYSELNNHINAIDGTMGYSAEKTDNADVEIKYALMLDSKTAICVYFIPKNGYTGNLTATVDGSSVEVTQLTASGYEGWYQVKIEGIGPKKLGQEFTVLASTDHGSAQIRLSALSYAYAVLNDNLFSGDYGPEAMEALYRYYLSSQKF